MVAACCCDVTDKYACKQDSHVHLVEGLQTPQSGGLSIAVYIGHKDALALLAKEVLHFFWQVMSIFTK